MESSQEIKIHVGIKSPWIQWCLRNFIQFPFLYFLFCLKTALRVWNIWWLSWRLTWNLSSCVGLWCQKQHKTEVWRYRKTFTCYHSSFPDVSLIFVAVLILQILLQFDLAHESENKFFITVSTLVISDIFTNVFYVLQG